MGRFDGRSRVVVGAKNVFSRRSAITWILGINVAVFVVLRLVGAAGLLSGHEEWVGACVNSLGLPETFSGLASCPWTVLSYMFVQYEPMHLIFNLLWFALFGSFLQGSAGERGLTSVYLGGGFCGAALFFLYGVATGFAGADGGLIGASAAVMAVVLAATVVEPERRIDLFLIGRVRIKWVAPVMIAISLVGFTGGYPGSNAAHLGGAIAGIVAGLRLRSLAASRRRRSAGGVADGVAESDEAYLDRLLDRVRVSGFEALSPSERTELFNLSKRLRRRGSRQ